MRIGVWDVESTGLDVKEDRIIEFAMIVKDENGKELDQLVLRICPEKKIAPKAIATHGIADADVAFEKKFAEVASDIYRIVKSCDFLVAHNGAEFDGPMLRNEFERVGLPDEIPPIFDTMQNGRGCTHNGKLPNLKELCWAYNVPYDTSKAHAALYDVEVLSDCFFQALKMGDFTL